MKDKLSDQQVENWRRSLSLTFGPYAYIMPREQVQAFRDRMQADVDRRAQEEPPKFCECDKTYYAATIKRDGTVECNKCHLPRV